MGREGSGALEDVRAISGRWHKVIWKKRSRYLAGYGGGRREKPHVPGTAPGSWRSGIQVSTLEEKEANRFWAIASSRNTSMTQRLYIKIY